MPYLNWKTAPVAQEIGAHPDREHRLELKLAAGLARELASRLEEIFPEESPYPLRALPALTEASLGATIGAELRLDLPRGWVVFWKRRDGESRLLVAHPQPDEWVVTVALEGNHGRKLVESLGSLQPGEHLAVGELAALGAISNVEISISVH